jgi:homoserine trans-succinylase
VGTAGAVQRFDTRTSGLFQLLKVMTQPRYINGFQAFTHNPVSDWIDVASDNLSSHAVGFYQSRSSTHEWV